MIEKIIQFGPEKCMLGIQSIPNNESYKDKPAILVLNSGLVHRVGPFGLGVKIARTLCDNGYLVIRFDLPGIGDSVQYDTNSEYEKRIISDVGSAIEIIKNKHNINKFISIGLCTGAMNSHVVTANDDRIVASILMDAYSYPTLNYFKIRYKKKLVKIFNPVFIVEKIRNVLTKKPHKNEDELEGVDYFRFPKKSSIRMDLENILSKNKKMLFIYTGGMEYICNYEEQLKDSFKTLDFNDGIDVKYFNKMDHTFILKRDREYLVDMFVKWINNIKV